MGTRPQQGAGLPLNDELTHYVQTVFIWIRYFSLAVLAGASLLVSRKRQRYFGADVIFGSTTTASSTEVWSGANPSIAFLLGFAYLYFALRRIYGEGWLRTLLKSAFVFAAVVIAEMIVVGGSVAAAVKLWAH